MFPKGVLHRAGGMNYDDPSLILQEVPVSGVSPQPLIYGSAQRERAA